MAKLIDLAEYRNKKKKQKYEGCGNAEYIIKARERDPGWRIFAQTVACIKNGGLTDNLALTALTMLIRHFGITAEEIKIDALIRAEFDGHSPAPGCLTDSNGDIIFALTRALQDKLIDRLEALRIIKVIVTWHHLDPEKIII
jgi:hypothetical protein